ncbi:MULTISPECIES: hypothetical protein, partial [unclassified Neisseria]|uniref:hypothetical protein n=1 Tax=unclassified Neisseria TaxID=2623750 RepID=UPI001430B7EE
MISQDKAKKAREAVFGGGGVNSIPKLSHSCGLKLSHPMSGVSSGKNHCPSQKYRSNKSDAP